MLRRENIISDEKVEIKPLSKFEKLIQEYKDYLTNVQGLASSTISRYLNHNQKFMHYVFKNSSIDYKEISANKIITFIQKYASNHGVLDSNMMVCSVRSLLRFLIYLKKIHHSLVDCVPAISIRKNKYIPSYLSKEELTCLLENIKGETSTLIRNYAILLLLSRLGLRAMEIVKLTLDDIDWENGKLTIHGKGNKQVKFPIPVDAGKALVAYLKKGRPNFIKSRKVFISVRVPYHPLKGTAAISSIVSRAVKKARLTPEKAGARLLRHTFATQCLQKGATLYEVGELLRHEDINTTSLYAKVDFKRLYTLAMPWPSFHLRGGEK